MGGKFLRALGISSVQNEREPKPRRPSTSTHKSDASGGFSSDATPSSMMMNRSVSSSSPTSLSTQLTRVALDDSWPSNEPSKLASQTSMTSMTTTSAPRRRPAPLTPMPAGSSSQPDRAPSPRPSQHPSVQDSFEWRYDELVEDDLPPFANLAGSEPRLNCLVVGAGFAGVSTAISLARQGFAVTVIEKGPGVSPHGDLISLGCNASKILARQGLLPDLWKHACRGGWWLLKDDEGVVLREESLKDFPALYGAPLLQGHRAQFLGCLGTEARRLRVRFRLNTEVISYQDSPRQPSLTTADGEVIFADVIVVADGVHSPGRDLLATQLAAADRNPIPASAKDKAPSEYSVHRSLMRADKIAADPDTAYLLDGNTRTWLGHDSHLTIAPLDNNRQLSFSFVHFDFSHAASLNWRDRRPIKEVLDLLDGWDPSLVKAIALYRSTLNWRKSDELQANQWFTVGGKIVLIGDAVHPLPPSSFQGGSQSIEDGASLAVCLALSGGTNEGVPRALEAFQAIRQPRVQKCLEIGHRQRDLWHSYMSSLCSSNLDLLISTAYEDDAELATMNAFERTVQTIRDPNFSLDRKLKGVVLSKLQVGRGPDIRSQFYPDSKKPTR